MRPLYIFDLDGTLADGSHRVHLIEQAPKRWDEYFELCHLDAPIMPVVKSLHGLLIGGADIWIFSGRSDQVAEKTAQWISEHLRFSPHIKMRPHGDHKPDDELKESWLLAMVPHDRERLVAVFDDRDRVVAMWRRHGVQCFQAAPGAF